MSEFKFKAGDTVRRVGKDNGEGAFGAARIGQVAKVVNVRRAWSRKECVIVIYDGHVDLAGNGGELWYAEHAELVPFEIPASPFYVKTRNTGGCVKVEVNGLRYIGTDLSNGEIYEGDDQLTRDIPGLFADGRWTLIDPPAPAVDPVVAATAEVQRLLTEAAAAKAECDRLNDELSKAEELRRNIGKSLRAAYVAMDKAIHANVGVEYIPV